MEEEEEEEASDGPPPRSQFTTPRPARRATLIVALLVGVLARSGAASAPDDGDNNSSGGGGGGGSASNNDQPIWSVIEEARDTNDDNQPGSTWQMLAAALFEGADGKPNCWNLALGLFIILLMLTTAIGNLFVIVAILIERNLRTIGNYLVLSLAIADLLVALLVMPLASVYLILDQWTLGVLLCDIWTSADVCCCTASILHLLAIALDRYWAVTRVDYIRCQRNERRILLMIFFVWAAACVISMGPAFGWKDAEYEKRILVEKQCLISQDVGYQVFATCATFYFPVTLTLVFYWKIYQVARKRIRRKLDSRARLKHVGPLPSSSSSAGSTAAPTQRQNQSIVKYEPKSGIVARFTQRHETINTTTCECACHLSQAQGDSLAGGANSQPETSSQLVRLAQEEEDGADNNKSTNDLTICQGHQTSVRDRRAGSAAAADGEQSRALHRTSSQIYDELDFNRARAPAHGNNSETNLRRRQSNLNSSSSCSRCNARRNRFQVGSPSNSLCSSSLQQDEDEEERSKQNAASSGAAGGLAKIKADLSSLSSTNCGQLEQISTDSNSLDDGRKSAAKRDQQASHLHRKSLGAGQCECCACAVCCCESAEGTDEPDWPAPGGEVVLMVGQPDAPRATEVAALDSGGSRPDQIVCSLVGAPSEQPSAGRGGLGRAHGPSLAGNVEPVAGRRHLLANWLGSTQNLIAICWRRLQLIRTKQSSRRTQHFRPSELSAAGEAQSTGLVPHANHQLESATSSRLAFCPVCQCPAACPEQPALIVQLAAHSAKSVAAAVASSTTQVALTAAESLVLQSKTFTNSSASQRPKVQLVEQQQQQQQRSLPTVQSQAAQMEGVESRRERKAAKTLAIITGVFVMCWLPFFVMAIAMPLLELKPHKFVFAFLLWLGYFNSMLNPIIYTIFSPDFRKAFKRLLCGQKTAAGGAGGGNQRRKRPNSSFNSNGSTLDSRAHASCAAGAAPRGCLTLVCHRLGGLRPVTLATQLVGGCCQWSAARDQARGRADRSKTMNNELNSTPNSSPRIIPDRQQQTASVTNLLSNVNTPTRSMGPNYF